MSRVYAFDNEDNYRTAVAAAAFAVHSLDRSKSRDKKIKNYGHGKSLNKTRSKAEKRTSAINFSDETSKQSLKDPDIKMPEKRVSPSPPPLKPKISFFDANDNPEWMGKPSALADKHLNDDDEKIPESPLPKPDSPPIVNPTAQLVGTTQQSMNKPGPADSLADAWEKEEMASIKERYERLTATIDNWEIKRKRKADRKLEMMEAKPNKSREKVVQSHRHEIKRIEEIAAEARAHAEAKRVKEELKVKEKANKIRLTGKLPTTCLCF